MSKQKSNLATVPKIQETDDFVADSCTSEAFEIDLGYGIIPTQKKGIRVDLSSATKLEIKNTNPGNENPNAPGHKFEIFYAKASGRTIEKEELIYGCGVLKFNQAKELGAKFALIYQI